MSDCEDKSAGDCDISEQSLVNNSFSSLSKRFKCPEQCGDDVDCILASNCIGLQTVRMNHAIWDIMSRKCLS